MACVSQTEPKWPAQSVSHTRQAYFERFLGRTEAFFFFGYANLNGTLPEQANEYHSPHTSIEWP